jgi:hypothetical protein
VLDGIELRTLYMPDTEAPAEFVFLLPAWRALWTAEVVTHVQHNLYTPQASMILVPTGLLAVIFVVGVSASMGTGAMSADSET